MRLALLAAAILCATPAVAQDAPRPPAYINAETCLRDKVADAVRVSSGASDAAEFLLGYLCAGPVGAAAAWERNTANLANMKQMFAGMTAASPPSDAEVSVVRPLANADAIDDEGAEDMSLMTDWINKASVDPVTGAIVGEGPGGSAAAYSAALAGMTSAEVRPAFLRELAGRLVVENHR